MIGPGSIVVLSLREPREQVWGVLRRLDGHGAVVEGIPADQFDAWLRSMAAGGDPRQHLSVAFFPMARVERLLLDRGAQGAPSLADRFIERMGISVTAFLDPDARDDAP